MVRRAAKKSRGQRGSRTYGYGQGKKHRGRADRGGNPNRGWNKRHWIRTLKLYPDTIGKHGFTSVWAHKVSSINVGLLDETAELMVERKLATREGSRIVIDATKLKIDKILGSGRVTKALVIIAPKVVESAKQKIESAGGEIRNA